MDDMKKPPCGGFPMRGDPRLVVVASILYYKKLL